MSDYGHASELLRNTTSHGPERCSFILTTATEADDDRAESIQPPSNWPTGFDGSCSTFAARGSAAEISFAKAKTCGIPPGLEHAVERHTVRRAGVLPQHVNVAGPEHMREVKAFCNST